eukprot:jgi/Chlat1/2182/Chrsp17S02741
MSTVRSSREDHAAAGKRKLQEYRLKKQQEAEDRAKRTSQSPAATTSASEAFAATFEADSRFNADLSESLPPARSHSNGSPQLSRVADQPSSQDIKRIEALPQAVDLHTIAPTYELPSTPLPEFSSSANTERPAQPAPFRVVENGIPFRDDRGSIDQMLNERLSGHLEHQLHTTVHSQANGSLFHHATPKSSGLPEDRSLPLQPQQNGEASYAANSVSQIPDEHVRSFSSASMSHRAGAAPPPPPSKSDKIDERYTALIEAATTREAKYAELQDAYNKLQARALDAERSLKASAVASAQTLQALRDSHAEELRSLQFQHAKLQNELETMQLQQKGFRTGLQKANEEKAALLRKACVEDLTQSQAALQAQWPSSKVSEFDAKQEQWQKERQQLEAELQAAFELRERSEEDRRKAMLLVAATKAQFDEVSAERTSLQRARDDMAAQLRVAKLRLQEAEEDQYKAEEDVGAMRNELERLTAALAAAEDNANHASQAGMPSTSPYSEELLAMQQERDTAITELKSAIAIADAERKRASMLELRANAANEEMNRITQQVIQLNNELRQLKYELANASQAVEDERQRALVLQVQLEDAAIQRAAEVPQQDAVSAQLTQELALVQEQFSAAQTQHDATSQRLHDAELLVQRLSASHGKLLAEIDSQSLEIERLFSENAGLSKGIRDASEISVSWERQVKELISQNAALRAELADSRAKAAAAASVPKPVVSSSGMALASDAARASGSQENGSLADLQQAHAHLEAKYAEAQERAEALAAQCAELTAKYTATIQSFSSIERAYDPVLSTIEMRLVQMRREVSMYIEGTA